MGPEKVLLCAGGLLVRIGSKSPPFVTIQHAAAQSRTGRPQAVMTELPHEADGPLDTRVPSLVVSQQVIGPPLEPVPVLQNHLPQTSNRRNGRPCGSGSRGWRLSADMGDVRPRDDRHLMFRSGLLEPLESGSQRVQQTIPSPWQHIPKRRHLKGVRDHPRAIVRLLYGSARRIRPRDRLLDVRYERLAADDGRLHLGLERTQDRLANVSGHRTLGSGSLRFRLHPDPLPSCDRCLDVRRQRLARHHDPPGEAHLCARRSMLACEGQALYELTCVVAPPSVWVRSTIDSTMPPHVRTVRPQIRSSKPSATHQCSNRRPLAVFGASGASVGFDSGGSPISTGQSTFSAAIGRWHRTRRLPERPSRSADVRIDFPPRVCVFESLLSTSTRWGGARSGAPVAPQSGEADFLEFGVLA